MYMYIHVHASWLPLAAVTCPAPGDIENGEAVFENVLWGSEVQFRCNVGFRLENSNATSSSATCLESGQWSEQATRCEGSFSVPYFYMHNNKTLLHIFVEVRCSTAPDIAQTSVTPDSALTVTDFAVNTTLTYTCDAGYRFIDGSESGSVTCDVTGVWVGIDSLADTNRCPVLRVVEHVQVEDGHMNATSGNSEVMVCEEGFIFADGSMLSVIECCGDDGGVSVNRSDVQAHMTINSTDQSFNADVELSCDAGYRLHDEYL